ncbi:MAG: hypothetical protein HY403_09870 [Elusimicrobia bacterium]|nr:hypothetical protein [Elusimicrobiota bacterium]
MRRLIALALAALAVWYGARLLTQKRPADAVEPPPAPDGIVELRGRMREVPNARPAPSGLDLLRGPGGSDAPPAEEDRRRLERMSAAGDALNKSAAAMLDSMAPILNDPAITRNMTPRQKSDYAELLRMIRDLKRGMAEDTAPSPREQQRRMLEIQRLMTRMMSPGAER